MANDNRLDKELIAKHVYHNHVFRSRKANSHLCEFCTNLYTATTNSGVNVCPYHYNILTFMSNYRNRNFSTLYNRSLQTIFNNDFISLCSCCSNPVEQDDVEAYVTVPLTHDEHIPYTLLLCKHCRETLEGYDTLLLYDTIICSFCKSPFQIDRKISKALDADSKELLHTNGITYDYICWDCIQVRYNIKPIDRIERKECKSVNCRHNNLSEIDLIQCPPICACNELIVLSNDKRVYAVIQKIKTSDSTPLYECVIYKDNTLQVQSYSTISEDDAFVKSSEKFFR